MSCEIYVSKPSKKTQEENRTEKGTFSPVCFTWGNETLQWLKALNPRPSFCIYTHTQTLKVTRSVHISKKILLMHKSRYSIWKQTALYQTDHCINNIFLHWKYNILINNTNINLTACKFRVYVLKWHVAEWKLRVQAIWLTEDTEIVCYHHGSNRIAVETYHSLSTI